MIVKGDRVLVKLDDADWTLATVVAREVTGHGTPARRVSYHVNVNGLPVTVPAKRTREI